MRLGSTGLTMAIPPTGASGDWRALLRPCDGSLVPVPAKLVVPLEAACNAPDGALPVVLRQGSKVRATFVGATFDRVTVAQSLSQAAGSWLALGSPGGANAGARSQQITLGNASAYFITYEIGTPAIAHRDYVVAAPEGYAALQFAMAPDDATTLGGDVQALLDTIQGYVTEPGGPAVPEGGRVFIGGSGVTIDLGPPDGAWRVSGGDETACAIAGAIAQSQFPNLRSNVAIGCARVPGELRALHWVGGDPMGALRAYRAGDDGPTAARDFASALLASVPSDGGSPAHDRRSVTLSSGVTAEWVAYSQAIPNVPGGWDGINAWFVPTSRGIIALEFHGSVGDGGEPQGQQIAETLHVELVP